MHTSSALIQTTPSEAPSRSLLQNTSAALVVCDEHGKVSYANLQAEGLLGVEAQLILEQQASSVFKLETPEGDPLSADCVQDLYRRRVKNRALDGCVLVRSDGQRLHVSCEIATIGGGATLLMLSPSQLRADPGSLAYRASHDSLTGLPNRSYLQERIENLHRIADVQRAAYSLLLLDLDHFKIINDRFGHATGDQVLAQVGQRIAQNVRELDTLGRWGGDEFLCLLPGVSRPMAEEIAERIRAGLEAQPVDFQGRRIRVTSSIGVATFPDDGLSPEALLAKADAALYEAKRSGRNRIQSVASQAGNVFALAQMVEKSLREGRVRPIYQTMVNLVTGNACGVQAMAGIQLDVRQVMEGARFMPAAEQLHLVHRIDHSIIRSVIERCASQGPSNTPMTSMFVNFSADFLRHPESVEDVRERIEQQCASFDDDPEKTNPLVIGITERQFMEDTVETREKLRPFLDMGVRIAIDHFGVCGSSLNCLIELPISFIKLEHALVQRVHRERRVHTVLRGIQELASDLGVITVAEGIENEQTLDALREIGVGWGQGTYLSHSMFQLERASAQEQQTDDSEITQV